MDFSRALELLKQGRRLTRGNWNGKGQWIELQKPNAYSKMMKAYIFIHPVDGCLVPWVASQTDLLADDWQMVEP